MKNTFHFSLSVMLAIFLSACGEHSTSGLKLSQSRILYGEELSRNEYPYVVELVDEEENTICSGTLLEEKFVLTAAHCLHETNRSFSVKVRGRTFSISSAIEHPQYNSVNKSYDIALIRLEQSIRLFTNITLYHLNTSEELIHDIWQYRDDVSILGFGQDENWESGHKKIGQTQIESYTEQFIDHYHHLVGSCYGDSGGPALIVQNNQVIILGVSSTAMRNIGQDSFVSFPSIYQSTGNCLPYNRYTRVDHVLDWIKSVVQI